MNPSFDSLPDPVLLALATSTERCSVALWVPSADGQTPLYSIEAASQERGSGSILSLIDALLSQAGLGRRAIDVIAFDQGPGAFTGVRLGCSVAQGLGYALEIPILALSSLEVMVSAALAVQPAMSLPAVGLARLVWCAADARLGQVYCACYESTPGAVAQLHQDTSVLSPVDAAALIESVNSRWRRARSAQAQYPHREDSDTIRIFAAGNGFARFAELAAVAQQQNMALATEAWPCAQQLARAALAHWHARRMITPQRAEPLYVRNTVALKIDQQRPRV